ncbi:flagellin, partial [Latilactobacillus curvatus]|uniref:flagellin N-terminal helical domain-containing protein n=1 Tax=Latilactobacillus curvatus TaxID=28038 RepID=UPI002A34F746|nr:flagellin [Latilactobacillus curvatus]
MRINTNVAALNTYSRLSAANASKSDSLAKLSSGKRINKAGDDAAGLAISEKMKAQIGGLKQAKRNAQDGISLIQTAEGALSETHSILSRMNDLAVQASNDTLTDDDRGKITKEVTALKNNITDISNNTEFNNQKLFNNDKDDKTFTFQVGASKGQTAEVKIG